MLKAQSVATLAGLAFAAPATAANVVLGSNEANELLQNKSVDTPTLDYLKENNILIPQKGEYNSTDKTWSEAEPIESPASAYTITTGTESDHSFEYKTADEKGNITSSYYKIELRNPEQSEGSPSLGISKNIQWSETPIEGGEYTTTGSIDIKLSDTETKTYYYGYTKPASYTTVENQSIENSVTDPTGTSSDNPYILEGGEALNNPEGTTTSINNVLYQNNTVKGILNSINSYTKYAAIYGGAVFNKGGLTEVIGDFVNNSVTGEKTGENARYTTSLYIYGGAIGNLGTIGNIKGNFINNSAIGILQTYGGAIYNDEGAQIGDITGDFINNSAGSVGGAIYNGEGAQIGDITGDFIGNSANTGSAIYNTSIIGNITGNFIGNNLVGDKGKGAIYNNGIIGNITGSFIGNTGYTDGGYDFNSGGIGIYNDGTIGNVTADFVMNTNGRAFENFGNIANIHGDFIYNDFGGLLNSGKIDAIISDFIGNSTIYRGAGFNNMGTVKLIQGNFINNEASIWGAGLSNKYKIDKIQGSFINNYCGDTGAAIHNQSGDAWSMEPGTWGYLYGEANIGSIEGDFIGNSSGFQGGAIFNEQGAYIGKIIGDFIKNTTISDGYSADGGAIHNSLKSTIDEIEGNFIGNYAEVTADSEYYSQGGAIQNLDSSKINKITGDFIGNYTKGAIASAGGAIFNSKSAEIGYIKGNFENNSAEAIEDGNYSQGGAIYNSSDGLLKNIEGDFIANHVGGTLTGCGGAIYNNDAVIEKVTGNFQNNYASGRSYVAGGAVYNYYGKVNELNGSFLNNYAKSENGTAKGGAIFSLGTTTLVADSGKTNIIDGNYVEDRNGKRNEAIYVSTGLGYQTKPSELKKVEGSGYGFYNKYTNYDAESIPPVIDSAFNIVAKDNGTFVINDIINGDTEPGSIDYDITTYYSNWNDTQRVYVDLNDKFLVRVKIQNEDEYNEDIFDYIYKTTTTYTNENGDLLGSEVVLQVGYDGDATTTYYDAEGNEISKLPFEKSTKFSSGILEYNLNFTGDRTGKIYLNNNVQGGANISLTNTNLYLGRDDVLNGNNLTLNGGYLSMINNSAGISELNKMTVTQNTDFVADVDLKNKVMDRFVAKDYGEHNGNVNVIGMNLLTDSNQEEKVTAVYFAQPGLKNNVTHNGLGELPDGNQTTVYTPIYKYTVSYDKNNQYDGKGDGGYFLFSRGAANSGGGASGGNPSDEFNPAILTTPVNTVAASQAGMTEAFKYVFEHLDAFTQLPAENRILKINANKYALAEEESLYNGISTDFNSNKGSFNYDESNKAYWLRPYATFENMSLKNGPKVDVITYGSLIGYDGDFKPMKHGWHRIGTSYIGYNGSQIKYKGADTTTNGGLLGFTETYYKGNFWSAITLSAGASVGETRTMYGKEDFATLLAGAASKTGYNFEFKKGKYILQPVMYLSYTFAKTFDYTNAAGVRIDTDPAHSLQLHPIIRGVANCKNGWQPYLQFGVVWNPLNKSNITANGVRMPEMSMKPYVEYGAGIQRNWDDKFTAFGQAMVRNGGRNGVALTAGFRWALDRDKNKDKVQNSSPQRKVVKQMSEPQKTALGLKPQNTTRTTSLAVLKQL